MANREFYVLIEQDEDEIFVSEVLKLKDCYTQGKTIDEVMTSMKEVIGLCFEDREVELPKFVGIQK